MYFIPAFGMHRKALAHKTRHLSVFRHFFSGLMILSGVLLSGAAYAEADMALTTLTITPNSGPNNTNFTATFEVTNISSATEPAANASLIANPTNNIPSGGTVTVESYSSSLPTDSCTLATVVVTCNFGTLSPGDMRTVTVVYKLNDAVGTWDIAGTVGTSTTDGNPANNTLEKTATTTFALDLSITGGPTSPPSPIASGSPFSYPVTVTNNGPFDLPPDNQVVVQFTVPNKVHYSSWSNAQEWSCTPTSGDAGTQVNCYYTGGLNNDESISLSINATGMEATGSAVDAVFGVTAQQNDGTPIEDFDLGNNTQTIGVEFIDATDVAIIKTAVMDTGAGEIAFTLTPQLRGGTPLNGIPITVTDTFDPTLLEWVSTTPEDGWTCNAPVPAGAMMQITCTLPEYLGDNYSNMPLITIRMKPLGGTSTATNTAGISMTGRGDPIPQNNQSVVVIDNGHSDLTSHKYTSFSPVVIGQQFEYQMVTQNNGPWGVPTGQVIQLDDTLPAGLRLEAAPQENGWSCAVSNNSGAVTLFPADSLVGNQLTIHCERSDGLAAGSSSQPVVLTTSATTADNFRNIVCSSLDENTGVASDPDHTNDCSSTYAGDGQVVATTQEADLQITKNPPTPNPVNAGELLTYTIDITNAGPDTATDIIVTDVLNPLVSTGGLDNVQITTQPASSTGSCAVDNTSNPTFPINGKSHTVRCNFPTIAPSETASITIVIRPNIPLTGTRTNTASVYSSAVGDPDRSNNTSSVNSTVIGIFDLTVTTWASTATASHVSSVPASSEVSFTTQVKSIGPSSAPNAKVTIQVPPNGQYIGLVSTGGASSCDESQVGAPTYQLVCEWNSAIPAGAVKEVTYTVLAPSDTSETLTSTPSVALQSYVAPGETDLTNNDASVTVTMDPPLADVQVDIFDLTDPVRIGETTTYVITVKDGGPSTATDVELTISFTPGNAVFNYQGNLTVDQGGICNPPAIGTNNGTFTCTWPALTPNQVATVTFDMEAESIIAGAQTGSDTVSVNVIANEPDSLPSNNRDTENTTASRIPPPGIMNDLGVIKTASLSIIEEGTPFSYTMVVTNYGPDAITPDLGAQLVDVLPSEITLSAIPAGCTYDSSRRTLSCYIANLAVNATYTVTVSVVAGATLTAPITNTARTDVPTDINIRNNTSKAVVTPKGFVDIKGIPTLSEWGLIIQICLMIISAGLLLHWRKQRG